jgi:acetylornithine deacetylase/succinyl-diaminopimelate desuccinylase-like protein
MYTRRIFATLLLMLSFATADAQSTPTQKLARDILAQLVAIKTTESGVGSTPAAEAIATRLLDAGFSASDVQVIGPTDRKKNLMARIHGTGKKKPILLLAHLDVVEAPRADWATDPFQLVEKDGFFYGRGTYDVKDGDAILVANLIRWKQQGFNPDRDIILALTADEELVLSNTNGVKWLLENHRNLIDAGYCLNTDGGDFLLSHEGRPLAATIQMAEKWYVDWKLELVNPGGHSSRPRKDNAIYELASALLGVQKLQFPAQPDEAVRAYFSKEAALVSGQLAADMRGAAAQPPDPNAIVRLSESPLYNALLRTTCVATMVQAGHAANALAQVATANVNCRVLPEMKLDEVRQALAKAVNDPAVKISLVEQPNAAPASEPNLEVEKAMEAAVSQMWPGLPVIPVMETGATDGKWLRLAGIPTYGISGVFIDPEDKRAHGKDERVGVRDFSWGVDFYDQLVKALAQ